jgi:two-component system, cell cycle sensor histidine kinase and response regulator CckA
MLLAMRRQQKAKAMATMTTSSVTPAASFNPIPASKPVILLVEYESIVRQVTKQVLEHGGYHVLESDGPREALRLAAEHRGNIGLLLSDVVMPEMNGPDLARRIQKIQPRLTTVFMSGYAEAAVVEGAVHDTRATYLQKPFTVDLLLSCVSAALKSA